MCHSIKIPKQIEIFTKQNDTEYTRLGSFDLKDNSESDYKA